MPKKNRKSDQYVDVSSKNGISIISNDSKSKNPINLGNKDFLYKEKGKKGIYFDDEIKEDDVTSSTNYWYRGELMKLVPDAQAELLEANEVIIEQKIELMEVLTGCETPNRYNVYLVDKNKQKKYLFKCKEESNWFCRNCLPSSGRSFSLRMIHIISSNKKTDYKKTIADFDRDFTFLCCCRPRMQAYYKGEPGDNAKDKKRQPMGKVLEPCGIAPQLLIYAPNGTVKYKIYGEYCQCGFWARDLSVGKCYEVDFWIYEGNADVSKSKPVGNVHKVFKGLSELVTDCDAFILTFPKKAKAVDRILLIGSVIMLDYRFYEDMACCDCIQLI